MLHLLPSLHTIKIVRCDVPGELQCALKNRSFPSVRMLVLGDGAAPFLSACPNVTHVRVCDYTGYSVVSNLTYCPKVQVFDGCVSWKTGVVEGTF